MLHYHGMPLSGCREDGYKFLMGRHAFVSFAAPTWVDVVADCCSSFAFDNGAFSAWTRGTVFDVDAYAQWAARWSAHPGFDWAVVPDVIDGTEADNDRLLESWPLPPALSVPVWHMHESTERLLRLATSYPRIALGSSGDYREPGTYKWWERMRVAMRAVCDAEGRPRTKLHGLRMLDPEIFTRLPLASADSTNVARHAGSLRRFGAYLSPSTAVRAEVIASRIEVHNSAPSWVDGQECLIPPAELLGGGA